MNEKEIGEIRRRYRLDKSNITHIRGCYVNDKKEIVAVFDQSLGIMSEDETNELLAVMKKTLSGAVGKNLLDIEFSTQQVLESDEHKLLMTLRKSELNDDSAVKEFYSKVIETINFEGSYLILLSSDKYDVPSYSKDGEKDDESSTSFSYFLCSVCPVKMTKSAISYFVTENKFRGIGADWVVSSPELGFMFPAFDDRAANIYGALYYTKSITDNHKEFVDTVFKSDIPSPAAELRETFQTILEETVSKDCDLRVVRTMHNHISEMVEEHKTKKEEPLLINKDTVKDVLVMCGIPEERVNKFEERYENELGKNAEFNPAVMVDTKQFEVRTPDVTIKVNPERSDLIKTRVIDGMKYILIRADEGVEVNGVNIQIS